MAQRVTQFAKRSVAKNARAEEPVRATNVPLIPAHPVRSDKLSRGARRVATAIDPIHLDLEPLVEPHSRYGRVSIRLERVPGRARLSRGRNNGDRSWSLLPEDLQELKYFPPEGQEAHTLGVRIISLDGGDGSTLAVMDYPVPAHRGSDTILENRPLPALGIPDTDTPQGDELQRMRNELTRTTALLSVRDSELAQARQRTEQDWAELSAKAIQNELTVARASWKAETDRHLSAVTAQAEARLKEQRAVWQAELDASRVGLDDAARVGSSRSKEDGRKEREAALSDAQKKWKAEEDARLAAAEAHWREQFARLLLDAKHKLEQTEAALTEARGQAASRSGAESEAVSALRGELVALKAALSGREHDIAAIHAAHEAAEQQWRREAARGEDAKLRQVREQLDAVHKALATREEELKRTHAAHEEAQRQWQRDAARGEDAKLRQVREQLDTAQKTLATRQEELEQTRAAHEEAQRQWQRDAARDADVKLAGIRKDAETIRAALVERDAELARLRLEHKADKARWREEADAEMAKAEALWRAHEISRTTEVQAKLHAQASDELAQALARAEQSESALKTQIRQVTARAESTGPDVERLRADLETVRTENTKQEEEWSKERAGLQAVLAQYKADLAQMHSTAESLRIAQAAEKTRALSREVDLTNNHDGALAELRASAEAERAQHARALEELQAQQAGTLEMLRAETEAALAARENELSQLRLAAERIKERGERDGKAALEKARKTWRIEEADRLQHAKARWQIQADKSLAKVTSRLEYVERALAEARAEAAAVHRQAVDQPPSPEVAEKQAEIEQARAATEQARALWEAEAQQLFASRPIAEETTSLAAGVRSPQEIRGKYRPMAFVGAAIVLCAAAVAAYFLFAGAHKAPPPAPPQQQAVAAPAAQNLAVVIHAAKIHAAPTAGSAVLAQAPRNAAVAIAGQRNSWTLVHNAGIPNPQHEGWIFSSYLKPQAAAGGATPH